MATASNGVFFPRRRAPQFAVAWESRRQNLLSSLVAVLGGPIPPKEFHGGAFFRDCWVRAATPRRALLASALWHVLLVIVPFPLAHGWPPRAQLTLPRIEVTWYGNIRDLPPIQPSGVLVPSAKPSPPGEPNKPLPRRGADAFHPRQTILSTPQRPTHPRQTLIQPDSPPEPPKILPPLPNIVQWADAPKPARPRLRISQDALARLRPKKPAMRPAADLPVPEVPNLEKHVGDLNIASSPVTVPKPRLPVVPASIPRVGPQQGGVDAAPAPEIGVSLNGGEAGLKRLIALSATPAAPPTGAENLPIPAGNLVSRVSISPEGVQPGVPGGSPTGLPGSTGGAGGGPGSPGGAGSGGSGSGPPDISISSGNPNATSSLAGLGGSGGATRGNGKSPLARLAPHSAPVEPSRTPPSPGFDRIKPGAPAEELFGPRKVYTLHVNMPNLASVTGSWVLSFVELKTAEPPERSAASSGELTGPVPVRKVDPKYPPALISAKVEGEVVLYAIIRRDGSVDSIQLVKGIDPQLDTNAMEALARWRFRPAERRGAPVELEAVVRIPFRAVNRFF